MPYCFSGSNVKALGMWGCASYNAAFQVAALVYQQQFVIKEPEGLPLRGR